MKFFFFGTKNKKTSKKNGKTNGEKAKQKRATVGDFQLRCAVNHHIVDDNNDTVKAHSPSHSISSASTQSSLHTLHQQETRGIFRTLEPVWSFLPDRHDQWIPLASGNQRVLEDAFIANQTTCTLSLDSLLSSNHLPTTATVYFSSPHSDSPSPKKKRPVTQFFTSPSTTSSSSPSTHHPQQRKSSPNLNAHTSRKHNHHKVPGTGTIPALPSNSPKISLELYLHQNLRRALVPYWWFEQDNEQGGKGMCRFDYKNQVRLEALSVGRSTLTLTDASFPTPFQVILESANRSLKEECCGFMYFSQQYHRHDKSSPKHTMDPLLIAHHDNDGDDGLYPDIILNRRCSI